ncbi:Acetyl-coenzyme A synthetase 2-like, mitochondrial [Aphelenchoides fujianensis]|nr:Acetyl-coenzyme A synthetase 2-like, mitochondrial [Aphelenchoides fujianensis]
MFLAAHPPARGRPPSVHSARRPLEAHASWAAQRPRTSTRGSYERSVRDPDAFWLDVAREFHFAEFSGRGLEFNFDVRKGAIFTRFLAGSKTNIAYNCLERAIANGLGGKVAYKWVGNEPGNQKSITYQELHEQVVAFSAVLRSTGVRKGDVVAIYLPMILELPVAMLACARIGAPHSRIQQAKARVLITADAFCHGPKLIHLKALADRAVAICEQAGHSVRTQIVVEHVNRASLPAGVSPPRIEWKPIDVNAGVESLVEWMDAEDQLFVLYTSGSTGQPKGIVHSTAGYMLYAALTCELTFDAQPDDVFWCTADCGWITGHSYVVYGPLLNGLTSIFFEGVPTYPTAARTWQMVEEHKVTKLYTSPTAVRSLIGFRKELVTAHDRSSLKIIGTVGEPINPKAWLWLHHVVGEGRAAVVDTYWQTETGGHVITALPGAHDTKPGSATLPFPGVRPVLVDNEGAIVEGPGEGNLCFAGPWPGISRTLLVREKIGPIAVPDEIQVVPGLPKTRSGKVTRRILRKIAEGDKAADLGDTSTLIDASIIDALWSTRPPTQSG